MIMGVVVSQVSDDAVNAKIEEAFEEDEGFQEKMDEQKTSIEKLKNEIKDILANPGKKIDPKKKEKLRTEIAALEKKKKDTLTQNKVKADKAVTLKAEKAKMSEEVAKLTKDLAEAEDELELMKDPSKFATMVVRQSGSGSGGDLEPTFIECRAEGIRVYAGKDVSFEVKKAEVSKSAKFQNLIKTVAKEAPYRTWISSTGSKMEARFVKREVSMITLVDKKGKTLKVPSIKLSAASRQIVRKYEDARKAKKPDPEARYVIFLVRDKGVSVWSYASQVCNKLGCRYGQLPLDGEGEIDLSLFSGS